MHCEGRLSSSAELVLPLQRCAEMALSTRLSFHLFFRKVIKQINEEVTITASVS